MTEQTLTPLAEIIREKVANRLADKMIENPTKALDMPTVEEFKEILSDVLNAAIDQRDLKDIIKLLHNAVGLLISTVIANYVKVSTITREVHGSLEQLGAEEIETEELFITLMNVIMGAATSGLLKGHDDLPANLLLLLKTGWSVDDQSEMH